VYLAELRAGGEWPFVLDLHPRLTVVVGLGHERSHRLAALVNGALCGRLDGLDGIVRVDGQEHRLTAELVAALGIPPEINVVLRASDLPGARVLEADDDPAPPPPPPPPPPEEPEESAELIDARLALLQAREARAGAELALAAGRIALDPDARPAMIAAEGALETARRKRGDAAERVRSTQAALDAARAEAAERRADTRAHADRRSALEGRRQELLTALGTTPTDPTPVAEALAELRRVEALPPRPVDEALALADAWTALQERRAQVPPPRVAPTSLVEAALETLEAARIEHTLAHEMARLDDLTPEDARDIEAAHAAVVEAGEKVENSRRPRPLARRRLEAVRAAEQGLLERLGLSSYHAYLLRTAPGLSTPVRQERADRADAALADAEAVWEELHAPAADDERAQELAAETNRVRAAAFDLLGDDPGVDVEGALRALRRPVDAEPACRELLAALDAVGASPETGADPAASASAWLAYADEDHARRAALQAELGGLQSDLDELAADAARSEDPDAPDAPDEQAAVTPAESSVTVQVFTRLEAQLDEARAAFEAATEREEVARRARNQASSRLENARSAELRVVSLSEELTGATAAHQQAAMRVEELEHSEVERRAAAAPALATPPMPRAPEVDLSEVEVDELEVYVLARLVGQRSVGQAGSLPLVIEDAFAGLPVETTEKAIGVLERFTAAFQLIYLSDDPEIEAWARLFGPKGASVRRFLSPQSLSAT